MKKLRYFLLAPFLLLLSACGATSGVVVDKSHTEGYYYFTYYSCGTPQVPMQCPQIQYMPPSWAVIVKQDEDGKNAASYISEGMYNFCQIGMRWERSTTDDDGHCE